MNRLLVAAAVVIVTALAVWHPAPQPPQVLAAVSPRPQRVKHTVPGSSAPPNATLLVYVVGAVAHPGLYRLQPAARAVDAVRSAGGLTAAADPAGVNLAAPVADGDQITVPERGATAPKKRTRKARGKRPRTRKHSVPPLLAVSVDVNSADASTLASVPGLGPTLAQRLVAYRQLNGPFASLDELSDVAGFTPQRVDAIAPYITVR